MLQKHMQRRYFGGNMSDIVSVCRVRTVLELNCHDCIYYGDECNKFKVRNGYRPYKSNQEKEKETDGN